MTRQRLFISTEEAAHVLGVTRRRVLLLIEREQLFARVTGCNGSWSISSASVARYKERGDELRTLIAETERRIRKLENERSAQQRKFEQCEIVDFRKVNRKIEEARATLSGYGREYYKGYVR